MKRLLALALALAARPAPAAEPKDLAPMVLPDGRYLLLATFPETADRVCFRFQRAEPTPDVCTNRADLRDIPIAIVAAHLLPGDVAYAVTVNARGESPLSAARWVVPTPAPVPAPAQ